MRPIRLSVITMIATFWAICASAEPACPAHLVVGHVAGELAVGSKLAGGSQPMVSRNGSDLTLFAGDTLCDGDAVANPLDSGVTIDLMINGARRSLPPGGGPVHVHISPLSAWITDMQDRFDRLFSIPARISDVATRGGCYLDLPRKDASPLSYVIRGSSSIMLSWPCPDEMEGPFMFTLFTAGHTYGGLWRDNFAWLRLDSGCKDGCTIVVGTPDQSKVVWTTNVVVVDPSKTGAPGWIASGGTDPYAQAALGAWLLKNERYGEWRIQAQSLLLQQGCKVAAAQIMAMESLGTLRIPVECPPATDKP